MRYKDILVPAIALAADEVALVAAGELALRFDAHAIALVVAVHLSSPFADDPATLSEVLSDISKGSASQAGRLREELAAWCAKAEYPFELRSLTIEEAVDQDQVVAHARMADLIVMTRAANNERARRALLEDILFKSGRPTLLLPETSPRRRTWERILIAWNAKSQAVRAVSAAMPLLQQAKLVVVATVDAIPSAAGHAEAPGRELAAHLARHGVTVEVRNLDGMGRSEGEALLDEAVGMDADAIVMGAYGHSRMQETLFGGVTRELLATASTPLFLMH